MLSLFSAHNCTVFARSSITGVIVSINVFIAGIRAIAILSLASFIVAVNSACCLARLPAHSL